MLFGDVSAVDGRLWHQFLLPENGIYVNLFIPSRVSWSQNNTPCRLTQTTEYPAANTTQLDFGLSRPESFTVYIRIPEWAGAGSRVAVNGGAAGRELVAGKFLALERRWKDGDRVEVEFDANANQARSVAGGDPSCSLGRGLAGAKRGRDVHAAALRLHHERKLPFVSDGGRMNAPPLASPSVPQAGVSQFHSYEEVLVLVASSGE